VLHTPRACAPGEAQKAVQAPAAAQHVLVRFACLPPAPPTAECRVWQAVPFARGLTLPSRGRHKGCALAPPLMSNVRFHHESTGLITAIEEKKCEWFCQFILRLLL
jgi:CO/xanthine dehydrogenase Mo-binding subunit